MKEKKIFKKVICFFEKKTKLIFCLSMLLERAELKEYRLYTKSRFLFRSRICEPLKLHANGSETKKVKYTWKIGGYIKTNIKH